MRNLCAAEEMLLRSEDQSNTFLVTAAASLIWVSPTYLQNQISNLETEILKAERLAMRMLEVDTGN